MSINLESYGLSKDPFPLQPISTVSTWAGRFREREALLDIVRTPLSTDIGTSEFTVIHGEYGSGKSHALRYLESMINEFRKEEFRSLAIYVPTIKMDSKTTFLRLYQEVVQIIDEARLVALAKRVQQSFGAAKDEVRQNLVNSGAVAEAINDQYLEGEVLSTINDSDVPMLRLVLSIAEENEQSLSYLQGSASPPAGLGLSGRVNSDFAAAKTLGGLFRVLTLSINGQPPASLATYLFLDEVETILDDRQTDLQQFFQGVRNLVNELPYNFCLLMSFSADTALIEAVIPQSVLQGMTRSRYIELPTLTPDDAKDFVRELFKQYRPEGFQKPNTFHPFSEESIELALERVIQMTPRQLFRVLNAILMRSIQRHGLDSGEEISADLADQILVAGGYH